MSFGIDEVMTYLWENNRVKPFLALIPKIIEFIGYDSLAAKPETLAEKTMHFGQIYGLSQKKLADQLALDQTTLAGWEKGKHRPSKRLLEKLVSLLTSFPSYVSMFED